MNFTFSFLICNCELSLVNIADFFILLSTGIILKSLICWEFHNFSPTRSCAVCTVGLSERNRFHCFTYSFQSFNLFNHHSRTYLARQMEEWKKNREGGGGEKTLKNVRKKIVSMHFVAFSFIALALLLLLLLLLHLIALFLVDAVILILFFLKQRHPHSRSPLHLPTAYSV